MDLAARTLPPPASLGAWILAARPKTLPAAAAPVAVGTACALAEGGAALGPGLAALGGALLIQIGTNFANDLFDHEKGADTPDRQGPPRAVAEGLISARQMRWGVAAAFLAATACGGYLWAAAGWPVVAIGVASILAGLAYTGGPYPLGYNGLGDLFVMIFFGFVAVGGSAWVQLGRLPGWIALPAAGVGAVATALIVVNNLRDRDTDVRAGKRTLAVRWGRTFSLIEYGGLLAFAALTPLGIALLRGEGPAALAMAGAAGLALGVPSVFATRALIRAEAGPEFNQLLGRTAGLLVFYAAVQSAQIIWSP